MERHKVAAIYLYIFYIYIKYIYIYIIISMISGQSAWIVTDGLTHASVLIWWHQLTTVLLRIALAMINQISSTWFSP